MVKVTIYGGDWCNPCRRTKQLSIDKGFETEFKDVTADPEALKEVEKKLGSKLKSIPVVFVNDEYLGGAEDFKQYAEK